MDFLVNSIASSSNNQLLGVVLAHFDVETFCSRANVKLLSMDAFNGILPELVPSGFAFRDGALLSDTKCNIVISSERFDYMRSEWTKILQNEPDLIDLVLQGIEECGFVVVNYDELGVDGDYNENGILIPFKNFRVSNSSFNIYASFLNHDEEFRSYSLLNLEDGSARNLVVAFPFSSNLSKYPNVEMLGAITVGDSDYCLYSVNLGLSVFYTSVGEAFLNYLAYNVAFYNIGEKTLKKLAPGIKVKYPPQLPQEREPRKPKVNVSIIHQCKNDMFDELMSVMGNKDRLLCYLKQSGEAAITYSWIQAAYDSPWYKSAESEDANEKLLSSCSNLLLDCRVWKLKYSLELLCHRYYLYSIGKLNDNLGYYLKGGGVYGQAVKWFDI